MRPAPPVGVTCSGAGAWRAGRVAVALLAAAVGAAWLALLAAPSIPGALAAAAVAAALVGGPAWHLTRPRPATLAWDGTGWRVDGAAGGVDVMLDLGAWLLLRFRPEGGGAAGRERWLPLPAAEAGAAWHGLRAALFAPAARSAPAAAAPQRQPD